MRAKKKNAASVPFESVLDKHLKGANKAEIIAYLNACLCEDGDGMEDFFTALNDIARAKGIGKLATKTKKTRDTYYKMFSGKNPTIQTLRSLLLGMDLDFQIVPVRK